VPFQDKYIKHTSPRETISQIAAHYNIKSSAIYDLNPDSRKGIKFKSILLIPTLVSKLRIPYHQLKILIEKKSFGLKQRNTLWYSETIRSYR
jgi:hypothetical protein